MTHHRSRLMFCSAIGLLCLMVACGRKDYAELAERPAEQAVPAVPTKEESLITLNALSPYETLSQALTTALPAEIPFQGREHVCMDIERQVQKTIEERIGGDVGKLIGGVARIITKVVTVGQVENLCLDVDYHATIRRDGNVIINQNGDSVRLSVPVRADGQAGFAGDLAGFLKLNKKNFRGALTATADIRLGVDENWCPTVSTTPDFFWRDKAELEVAGKFWINIDGQAGPEIKKAMSDAAAKIPSIVTCDQLKKLVQPIWHEYAVSLPAIAGQPGKVVVTPQRVGFSGLSYTPTGTQLALMITAQSEVRIGAVPAQETAPAASSVPVKELPLPKLEKIPAQQNTLKLAVPITASYASIQSLASAALVDKPFEGKTDTVSASVTVKEVTVYPSAERLVVGVRFESKISKPKSLAPQGWVYLIAKPSFDLSTQTLTLTEVDFSRIIDNDLWNLLSFLFQDQIRKAVVNSARIDLRPQIAETRATLHKELSAAAAMEGVNINLKDDFLGLSMVAVTDAGVQVVVGLEGAANIVVLNRPNR